jgi:putative membrane protein
VYFAAERTLLAWLRTGIGIMAFGFVVARFGLVVRLLHPAGSPPPRMSAGPLGVALVVLGTLATGAGAVQYRRFCRRLAPEELPSRLAPVLAATLAWLLAAIGAALAMVLAL